MLVVFHASVQTVWYFGEGLGCIFCTKDWLWQFCRCTVQCSVEWKVLPTNHCQVILDGGTSMCSKNYFFTASLICTQTMDTKISCYARPVLIPVSCVPVEPSRGLWRQIWGLQISRHRWAVLIMWIHPWQPKKDVAVVILGLISCIVACVLQCQCQWIINCDKLSCSSTPSSTPQKRPTLCELVAVDVRPANVQQEILLKIDTNTVKINLNVTFTKEMPTQYHTGCHWQLSRKCKRQN